MAAKTINLDTDAGQAEFFAQAKEAVVWRKFQLEYDIDGVTEIVTIQIVDRQRPDQAEATSDG